MLTILTGDSIEQLRTLPDESVQCCVTSPPYWGLRDYGTAAWEGGDSTCDHIAPAGVSCGQRADRTFTLGEIYKSECGKCGAERIDSQLGLEKTPEEYVANMVEVFREVRRVLRKDGTLWMNLGDSYASSGGEREYGSSDGATGRGNGTRRHDVPATGLKPKDLCGIPWRVAFALQADGWWLRSDIIWAKPNPMPESVTDRPTKAHEYLFLLTKSASYFYDAEAIKEPAVNANMLCPVGSRNLERTETYFNTRPKSPIHVGDGRNKRSVWTVATAPYPEAHFATYPPDLIKPCIMAGTSAKGCCAKCGAPWERVMEREYKGPAGLDYKDNGAGRGARSHSGGDSWRQWKEEHPDKTLGWQPTCKCTLGDGHMMDACTVLDPFAGSGTTGAVALELGRKAVLIELNPKYVELIRQRCDITPGLQLA